MVIAIYIDLILIDVIPNIGFTNLSWWLGGIFTTIGGIVLFLFKHKLKSLLLDSSPNPKIVLSHDGSVNTVITFAKNDMVDIDNTIRSKVNEKVIEISKKYPFDSLDAYNNPILLFGGTFKLRRIIMLILSRTLIV